MRKREIKAQEKGLVVREEEASIEEPPKLTIAERIAINKRKEEEKRKDMAKQFAAAFAHSK